MGLPAQGHPRIALYYEHLFPESRGGGERLYGALAEAWSEDGAAVTYFTREHPPVQQAVLRSFDVVFIAPSDGVYDPTGRRSPSGALAFAWEALKTTRSRRSTDDCVVVSSTPALLVFAARLGLAPRRGRVLIVDWLEVWTRRQWTDYLGLGPGLAAWALQWAAVWTTPTATCHSQLMEARLKAIRPGLEVLLSPGLIDAAEGDSPPPLEHETPLVLVVSRLIEDKQVVQVPATLAAVRRDLPTTRCVIVGAGPELAAIQAEVDRLGLVDHIEITSGLTDGELGALMRRASCLLHPSRREGYGLVVVEAARYGTPVVVARAPDNAAQELIEDGVNGYVAGSADPEALARLVRRCIDGGQPLRDSTRAWYETAIRTRSVRRTAEGILEYFRSARGGT